MRAYIYWPFARSEDAPVFEAVGRAAGHATLQVLDRPGVPRRSTAELAVLADLPPETPRARHDIGWAVSRLQTHRARSALRSEVVRGGAYDIAHVAFLNPVTDRWALPRLARVTPLVTTIHDVVPHGRRLPTRVQDRVLADLYRRCGAIVVHHRAVADELAERFSIGGERVRVVPLPVAASRPADDVSHLGELPTVLLFGTLRPNKGIEVLVRAAEALRDTPLRFHVAGRGDAAVERAVVEAGGRLPHFTAEVGWVDPERKRALYREASVVALPYTSFASQSAVLHDAYGAHVPVVGTDVGALGRTIADDGTGIVVPPGDAEALAAALLALATDVPRWTAARDATVATAARRSPEAFGRALVAVYAEVAERTGRAS